MKRLLLIAELFAAALAMSGCITPPPPIPKPPNSKVDQLCKDAMTDYAQGLAASFAGAGTDEHETAESAHGMLSVENKKARTRAFSEIDDLINRRIGGEKWDKDEAAELFGELAAGFEKAAK